MHIYVKDTNGHVINLRFPTRLILNNVTASVGSAVLNKYVTLPEGMNLNASQLRRLTRAIHACRKRYPGLYFVEVNSADGEEVRIKL